MRRAAKVDSNQNKIITELRARGISVTPTHMVGRGFPDIVCGFRGVSYLFEIKDGAKSPSARRLTDDEKDWHDKWQGHVSVILCVEDALEEIFTDSEL